MMKYAIKQRILTEPEIKLPEGSLPVSVKHRDAYTIVSHRVEIPEAWQVIWLEPIVEGVVSDTE